MHWQPTKQLDSGRFLAVAIKVMNGVYQEFAGIGRTEPEAKRNATLTMWRESRRQNNLPGDHVVGAPMSFARRSR